MRVISGGQTGVDRGALDAAMDVGVPVGGWCPAGRRDENGKLPQRYAFLKETPQPGYIQRTLWNIRDADVTLILHQGSMGPGTRSTQRLCREKKKEFRVVDMTESTALVVALRFYQDHQVATLNVAGPRESISPGVQERTRAFMRDLLTELALSARKS